MKTVADLITAAQHHVDTTSVSPMRSSAVLCLADARAMLADGDTYSAAARALNSLAYSVGVFHPDYQSGRVVRDAQIAA